MSESCIYIPSVKKNNKEVSSKLFLDLLSKINDRNLVISAYSMAISNKNLFNSFDEYEEPLANDVINSFDIAINFKDKLNDDDILESLNLKNKNEIVYDKSFDETFNKIRDFNSKKEDKIIIIKQNDNGFYGEIVPTTIDNIQEVENQEYLHTLNNKMRIALNELGFDVSRVDNLNANGVFSPEDAEKNANELIDIIKLSKGIEGDYAFSEEFSHFLVAGLRRTELINRLLNTLDDNAIQEILGDEYESYKNRYSRNARDNNELQLLLKEEVAGKLLAERLNNNITYRNNNSLWNRFETYVKNNFKDKDENRIINIINETKREFDNIKSQLLDNQNGFIKEFNKLDALMSKNLAQINNRISDKFKELNKNIIKIKASKKQLFFAKNNPSLTNEETRLEQLEKIESELKQAENYFTNEEYALNCISFLQTVNNELTDFFNEERQIIGELTLNKQNHNSFVRIGKLCGSLNNIKDFLDSYLKITADLINVRYEEKDLPDRDAISDIAIHVNENLLRMKNSYKDLRSELMEYWLKTYYWDSDKQIKGEHGEMFTLTLEAMLREAPKDINGLDLYISEMGHCSDTLLNLISTIHKKAIAQRDKQLEDIHIIIASAYKKLGGGSTDFMYERKNGQLTGRIKSEYDFDKFNEDYNKYKESIKDEDDSTRQRLLTSWKIAHTKRILVDKKSYKNGRTERVPDIDNFPQYKINNWDAGMTTSQKEFYNTMLELKAEMETSLGPSQYHLFLAPQVSTDYLQAATSNRGAKGVMDAALAKVKTTFKKDSNDTDFGELTEKGEKLVITDMHGEVVKKIPMYFVTKLSDMNKLNTDFAKSISAYSAMAMNYKEMSKIINQLETLKDLALDRAVDQYNGDNLMVNAIKTGVGVIKEKYQKKGSKTNIGEKIEKYYDMNFYGMQKDDGKTINLFGCEVSLAKFSDWIKSYSGTLNLGINAFSAASNVNVGEVQLFIEAMANSGLSLFSKGNKQTFGLGELLKAHAIYLKELPKIFIEQANPLKTNYLSLMMRKFDTEQTFFEDLKNNGYYNNAMQRVIGNNSLGYVLQNAGEHFLHGIVMIAMLKAKKVLVNGQKMSLYDAYKVEGNKLVEKGEIKELDGSKFTNNKFTKEKLKIQEISHELNGAFSTEDLGTLQSKAWGRLLIQFRQWMPGHWGRRFASKYFNTATDMELEGYWKTAARVAKELAYAAKTDGMHVAEVWHGLNDYEKLNLYKILSEMTIMLALSLLIRGAFAGDDDDDDEMSRLAQFYKYQLKRTYMEIASTMPIFPIDMYKNTTTMLQSPMAAIKATNNIMNLFCFWNLGNEIQSGRYEGWSVYRRDALNAIPYFSNIRKIYDLSTETYMFNIFP